jgi:hypothetical protein
MRFRHVVILSSLVFVACKTNNQEGPEPPTPDPAVASPVEETLPPVAPSSALQTTPHLVTPGPDEILVRRGPGARCPNTVELDEIEQAVQALGRDTINLVGEDLVNIRKTSTRTDRDGIGSCCNQLEQLVQDVEIMNEDKSGAVPSIDRIRRITVRLCPAA